MLVVRTLVVDALVVDALVVRTLVVRRLRARAHHLLNMFCILSFGRGVVSHGVCT